MLSFCFVWSSGEHNVKTSGFHRMKQDQDKHAAKLAQKSINCDRNISHRLVSDTCHVICGKVNTG